MALGGGAVVVLDFSPQEATKTTINTHERVINCCIFLQPNVEAMAPPSMSCKCAENAR
jgi:hypothetical protein